MFQVSRTFSWVSVENSEKKKREKNENGKTDFNSIVNIDKKCIFLTLRSCCLLF